MMSNRIWNKRRTGVRKHVVSGGGEGQWSRASQYRGVRNRGSLTFHEPEACSICEGSLKQISWTEFVWSIGIDAATAKARGVN